MLILMGIFLIEIRNVLKSPIQINKGTHISRALKSLKNSHLFLVRLKKSIPQSNCTSASHYYYTEPAKTNLMTPSCVLEISVKNIELMQLLEGYSNTFAVNQNKLAKCKNLGHAVWIKESIAYFGPNLRLEIDRQLQRLDKSYYNCIDYCKLNSIAIEQVSFSLPCMGDTIDPIEIQNPRLFSMYIKINCILLANYEIQITK